jgi:23S rRNA pseudouridine2605 synthase
LITAGRVTVDGAVRRDPHWRTDPAHARIEVDGQVVKSRSRVYLALNKPRGLVTTASDEKGRPTVYRCLEGKGHPRVFPVGRLDQASEGLLLFTNDTAWGDALTRPDAHLDKVYHVQIDRVADDALLSQMREGVVLDGERLTVKSAAFLRSGGRTSWVEVVLDEGRNRQIRRVLSALGVEVLRLVRVAIGPLQLGTLPKGETRLLSHAEVEALREHA